MQFVSISKSINQALLWFSGKDLAEYLNVHRHTIYGHAKKADFFHLNGHDIYKFNYDVKVINNLKQFEKFPESAIFKKANAFKNENLDLLVMKQVHEIAITFLTLSFNTEEFKKRTALETLKKLKVLKDAINPCLIRELEIIKTLVELVKDYYSEV